MHGRELLFLSGSSIVGLPALTTAAQSAPGAASPESEIDPDAFRFAIVADLTGGERPGVFADAVGKLNMLQPEFVMSVGDLIEGYTGDEAELVRQWEAFEARAGTSMARRTGQQVPPWNRRFVVEDRGRRNRGITG